VTTAEGQPCGATKGPRREQRVLSRSEAEGSLKDLARPRSASASEEHAGDFEEPV
jgi:hypothetical protein